MQTTQVIDRCEWPLGCKTRVKFTIWRIRTGEKLKVCSTHDSIVGRENLMACGCSLKEAVLINRQVKHQQKGEEIK